MCALIGPWAVVPSTKHTIHGGGYRVCMGRVPKHQTYHTYTTLTRTRARASCLNCKGSCLNPNSNPKGKGFVSQLQGELSMLDHNKACWRYRPLNLTSTLTCAHNRPLPPRFQSHLRISIIGCSCNATQAATISRLRTF